MHFMPTINNKLKVLRAERNMTQEQLAIAVGVTRSTINYLEKGEYMPSLALAFKLSRFFDQSIEQLFIPEEL
jgi:putative transcriptional regulator